MTPEEAFVLGYRECLLREQLNARLLGVERPRLAVLLQQLRKAERSFAVEEEAWEAEQREIRGLLSKEDADALLEGEL